jgi:predicted phage tail protein
VVLVTVSLSGSHHRLDFLIGPGRALDPARWCVICVDPIANGMTTSPSNSTRQPGALFPRFERWLIDSEQRGVGYRVINARTVVAELDHLHHPTGERGEVRIVPVLTGAKSAFGQILLGAALIAASFFFPPAAGAFLAAASKAAFSVGVSLVLGGVAQMLTPTPKNQGPQERPENRPSYQFNGPVNTTAQGQPVPIGYGRLVVGSAVISAGITAVQVPA